MCGHFSKDLFRLFNRLSWNRIQCIYKLRLLLYFSLINIRYPICLYLYSYSRYTIHVYTTNLRHLISHVSFYLAQLIQCILVSSSTHWHISFPKYIPSCVQLSTRRRGETWSNQSQHAFLRENRVFGKGRMNSNHF